MHEWNSSVLGPWLARGRGWLLTNAKFGAVRGGSWRGSSDYITNLALRAALTGPCTMFRVLTLKSRKSSYLL